MIEQILGSGTLTPIQLTYASYALMALTTLLTILLLRSIIAKFFSSRTSKHTNHILFVGPEKTGKTVLTNLIARGSKPHHDTVTSMVPTHRTGPNQMVLTDFPGCAQARNASLTQQLKDAKGVVFLIDGRFQTMTDEARASAALMKRVLINAAFRDRHVPMLVAFNKIDLIPDSPKVGDTVESSVWLQSQKKLLQRELDVIKDEMLTSTGDNVASHQLGTEQAFDFEMDVESEVSFCCCTTENGMKGVKDVIKFCRSLQQ